MRTLLSLNTQLVTSLIILGSSVLTSLLGQPRPAYLEERVNLTLERTQIDDVIRLLARQHGFNVTIAGDVSGEVSTVLRDVPLAEALDAVLLPNNLSWYLKENLMVVKSSAVLAEDEKLTAILRLRHISALEAQQACKHLLSQQGTLEIPVGASDQGAAASPPTTIVITDRPSVVHDVMRVIDELDQPQPLVNISVKLVETNLSDEHKLGVNWPGSYQALFGAQSIGEEETGGLVQKSFSSGGWIWGTFTATTIQTALDLMLESGRSRLLSDPNLTTVSNRPAQIAVTTTIPIQTLNRFTEGAVVQDIVSFQDLDVGITLRVTARIVDSNTVMLDVSPVIEEITGFTGPVDNQRPITSKRSVNTNVRVGSGETLVIGGLLRDSEIKTIRKLPLLGHLPLLGKLFQHHSKRVERTDLTIFITPRIIATQ